MSEIIKKPQNRTKSRKEGRIKPPRRRKYIRNNTPTVNVNITGIDRETVHNKIMKWHLEQCFKKGRKVKLMETYRDALAEFAKTLD